jgi:hypothetical protein
MPAEEDIRVKRHIDALHMEDQDAARPQPAPVERVYVPGEEAGDVGVESREGPMKHQGVGPGDPHTGAP